MEIVSPVLAMSLLTVNEATGGVSGASSHAVIRRREIEIVTGNSTFHLFLSRLFDFMIQPVLHSERVVQLFIVYFKPSTSRFVPIYQTTDRIYLSLHCT